MQPNEAFSVKESEESTRSLRSFAMETSAHGWKNAFSSRRGRVLRIIWILGVLLATGSLVATLYTVHSAYRKFPFRTIQKIEPRKELRFPTITVCNLNDYNVTALPHPEQFRNIMMRYTTFSVFAPPFNESQPPYSEIMNMSIDTVYDVAAPKLNTFLVLCFWHGRRMNCSHIFRPIDTYIGRCFIFNGNTSSPELVNRIGSIAGLRVIVNVDQEGGYVNSDNSAGVKIHLHEAHEFPDMASLGFILSPGESTLIGIQRMEYNFLPTPYKAFGDEACFDTKDPSLKKTVTYSDTYSLDACLKDCIGDKILKKCKCKPKVEKVDSLLPFCTLNQTIKCFRPYAAKYYDEARVNKTCDCPRPCAFTRYDTRLSRSYFPSRKANELLRKIGLISNIIKSREDYLEFKVFYEDLFLQEAKHVPEYTLQSIMGTVGGQMGLLLGASLLTLAELGEFILFTLFTFFRHALSKLSGVGQVAPHGTKQRIIEVKPAS